MKRDRDTAPRCNNVMKRIYRLSIDSWRVVAELLFFLVLAAVATAFEDINHERTKNHLQCGKNDIIRSKNGSAEGQRNQGGNPTVGSDRPISRKQDDEEETTIETKTIQDVLRDEDDHEECQRLAQAGACNSNPSVMLYRCSRTCLLETNDLLEYGYFAHDDESHEECVDLWQPEHSSCEDAAESENDPCIYDPNDMKECARTCLYCIPADAEIFDIGVAQEVGEDPRFLNDTIKVMEDTLSYMANVVMANEDYAIVRRVCRNEHELCSYWAATGYCTNEDDKDDEQWTTLNCGPACQTCEMQDIRSRCPIPPDAEDVLEEGHMNRLFERIVGEGTDRSHNYTVVVHSRPDLPTAPDSEVAVVGGPWVVTLRNFLTDEECDRLIELGITEGHEQSVLMEEKGENPEDYDPENLAYRTSTNAWCTGSCYEDPVARRVMDKIANLTGIPETHSEYLQLLKYLPGQFYKVHHDYGKAQNRWLPYGPRILTVFIYLNNVQEGGETRLNELKSGEPPLDVKPERGSVLIWPNVLNDDPGGMDDRTFHEALPVLAGVKYGANAWLRLRNFKSGDDCYGL